MRLHILLLLIMGWLVTSLFSTEFQVATHQKNQVKFILANNKFFKSAQFLAGTDIPAQNNNWRLGVQIIRLLKCHQGS